MAKVATIQAYSNRASKTAIARDGECAGCGSKEDLTGHHIEPHLGKNGKLAKSLSNIITLCKKCHVRYHQICNTKKIPVSRHTLNKFLGKKVKRKVIEPEVVYIKRLGDRRPALGESLTTILNRNDLIGKASKADVNVVEGGVASPT